MKRLVAAVILVLTGTVLLAQSGNVNTVLPENIKVRSGPGENFIAIGALFAGDAVTPLNRSLDGTWVLIVYGRGTGWIQRQAIAWQDNVDVLPVLPPNVTPTAIATATLAPFVATESPLLGVVLLNDADRAFVRAGPGRGYMRLGQLNPGTLVDPVGRNADSTWIMIRFKDVATLFDGFGWVARNLVQWRDEAALEQLPVVLESNLTPTLTFTPTETLIASETVPVTATSIPVVTDTPAPTATDTATIKPPTSTNMPTNTPVSPTATWTVLPPSAPPTLEATVTLITDTAPFQAATPTLPPTATAVPTGTAVPVVAVVTDTPLPLPTTTPVLTATAPPPDTPVPVITAVPENALPVNPTVGTDAPEQTLPVSVIVAAGVILVALIYIGMFAQGMSAARRYEAGFVIETCPVCHRGMLNVEVRRYRTFGIPGVKRTVRCSDCRSVLREKGTRRWIYAVDRIENPPLYERLNGREISDAELKKLV